ncbi:MAG: histidinol-phosphatase [Chthonomonadales bacterium]|nr:histidinol-phosphatase [Chthonomonadales bacterium]
MIDGFLAADYQVHTRLSHDGRCTIIEQCERAVTLGLEEIGFSEHKDFDPADPVVDYFDYDRYAAEIAEARTRYAGRLTIRMGVEVDYQRWFEDRIAAYLSNHRFDYVIGSVHYAGGAMLMTPEYTVGRDAETAYRVYYEAVRDSVDSGLIDILGHLEYANRRGVPAYGAFDPAPYRAIVSDLFARMAARGVALEINTAGLRQGAGSFYPCVEHVALYSASGGRLLTLGSDSHHPDDLAADYAVAARAAWDHGLREIAVYEDRTPRAVPLRPAG